MKKELNDIQAKMDELQRENNELRAIIENEAHLKENLMIESKIDKEKFI